MMIRESLGTKPRAGPSQTKIEMEDREQERLRLKKQSLASGGKKGEGEKGTSNALSLGAIRFNDN